MEMLGMGVTATEKGCMGEGRAGMGMRTGRLEVVLTESRRGASRGVERSRIGTSGKSRRGRIVMITRDGMKMRMKRKDGGRGEGRGEHKGRVRRAKQRPGPSAPNRPAA